MSFFSDAMTCVLSAGISRVNRNVIVSDCGLCKVRRDCGVFRSIMFFFTLCLRNVS